MKFSVAFDGAIAGLLAADPKGIVVITFNPSQGAWQQRLERRLARAVRAALARATAATSGGGASFAPSVVDCGSDDDGEGLGATARVRDGRFWERTGGEGSTQRREVRDLDEIGNW
jgi:hypothetical protein